MFECEHRWELVLWGSTEVLGVVSGISRQCLMHILADLLSKITSCEQLKGDCTKSPSPQARQQMRLGSLGKDCILAPPASSADASDAHGTRATFSVIAASSAYSMGCSDPCCDDAASARGSLVQWIL